MKTNWAEKHEDYAKRDWIDKPSLFAQTAIGYFPKSGRILDLGAGQGQDSRYFGENGLEVVSTDLDDIALEKNKSKLPPELLNKVTTQTVDLREDLPFENESFDVVYAHLSLHYFTHETTERIFAEIHRVLKAGGVFAFFVNSTTDPEYGTGEKLEEDYFQVDVNAKRFFNVESARDFAKDFTALLVDDQGETYKDMDKGVHNLIRFIGKK